MDPPRRAPGDLEDPPSRVNSLLRPTFASTSNVKDATASSSVTTEEKSLGGLVSTMPDNPQGLDPSADDILGQFSFAPATQTTIVTTTTTTTTSFPPLMIKAPHHLHELDPKMYPLASSPTPKSIKRFCFDIGGRPTFFSEADDTRDTLEEVCQFESLGGARQSDNV